MMHCKCYFKKKSSSLNHRFSVLNWEFIISPRLNIKSLLAELKTHFLSSLNERNKPEGPWEHRRGQQSTLCVCMWIYFIQHTFTVSNLHWTRFEAVDLQRFAPAPTCWLSSRFLFLVIWFHHITLHPGARFVEVNTTWSQLERFVQRRP